MEDLADALFAMAQVYFYAEFLMEVFGQVLGGIDAAVLASRTTETEHEMGKAALHIPLRVCVGQLVHRFEKGDDFAVFFQKFDDWTIQAGQLFVGLIASGIVCDAAVKDIASSIAGVVLGDAFLVTETEYPHHEFSLCAAGICLLVVKGSGGCIELREVNKLLEHGVQIRVR